MLQFHGVNVPSEEYHETILQNYAKDFIMNQTLTHNIFMLIILILFIMELQCTHNIKAEFFNHTDLRNYPL